MVVVVVVVVVVVCCVLCVVCCVVLYVDVERGLTATERGVILLLGSTSSHSPAHLVSSWVAPSTARAGVRCLS